MNINNRIRKSILTIFVFYPILFQVNAQNPTWFTDVTNQVGGAYFDTILNYRIYAVDVNNDDYPDLLLQYNNMQLNQLRLFINTADASGVNERKFIETTATSGINPPNRSADMAAIADFNNDGNVDFITNVWNNKCNDVDVNAISGLRYFAGHGDGTFSMSTNSGLETIPSQMAGSCLPLLDYNRDGNLDFFCGTQFDYCTGEAGPKYLFKGNGDGTFTDVSAISGITANNLPLFGSNVADWNNDGNQDILTAPYTIEGCGNLFKNNGNGTFTDLGTATNYNVHWLLGDNGQPMVPWEAMPYDYDNDGDIDFLVMEVHGGAASTEGRSCIFTNLGPDSNYKLLPELNRIKRDNPQASHKGDHKGNWIDFDNDGLEDIMIGEGGYTTRERLYFLKQDTTHNFNDITKALGWIVSYTIAPEITGPHAIEPIDFDMDGDDDIVVGCLYNSIVDKRFLFLQNNISNANNWIKIKLKAPQGVNKSCIGARIYVKTGGVTQQRDIYAGQGHFCGQQPFALNFGLGKNTKIDTIIVSWPDSNNSKTVITGSIPINKFITISDSIRKTVKPDIKISVYPNPLTGKVQINISNSDLSYVSVIIHNILGEMVVNIDKLSIIGCCSESIDLSQLLSGIYSLEVVINGRRYMTKIMKE
jgi:enediyne biosynthesis protein E4